MSARVAQSRASTRKSDDQNHVVYEIQRRKRFWAVINPAGQLVCMTVYKRGAKEVVRLLTSAETVRP